MIEVGKSLVIKGDWDTSPTPPGRTPIIIAPSFKSGMGYFATGFGYEPSTRAFLEELERTSLTGARVFDVGCGSGILGIAAALFGASRVHCTDLSPAALDAARANVRLNGLTGRVTVEEGTIPTTTERPDLLLCNVDDAELAAVENRPDLAEVVLTLNAAKSVVYRDGAMAVVLAS